MDLMDSGSCHILGALAAKYAPEDGDRIFAAWLLHPLANVMLLADIFKRAAEEPGLAIEIDMSIKFGPDTVCIEQTQWGNSSTKPPAIYSEIGPFSWTQRSEMASVFAEMEYQIYASFGQLKKTPTKIDFERAFSSVEATISESLIRSKGIA